MLYRLRQLQLAYQTQACFKSQRAACIHPHSNTLEIPVHCLRQNTTDKDPRPVNEMASATCRSHVTAETCIG